MIKLDDFFTWDCPVHGRKIVTDPIQIKNIINTGKVICSLCSAYYLVHPQQLRELKRKKVS